MQCCGMPRVDWWFGRWLRVEGLGFRAITPGRFVMSERSEDNYTTQATRNAFNQRIHRCLGCVVSSTSFRNDNASGRDNRSQLALSSVYKNLDVYFFTGTPASRHYPFPRPFDLFPAIKPQPLEPSRKPKSYQPPVLLTAYTATLSLNRLATKLTGVMNPCSRP